jgi:phage shock protein PspC (stress-responsive transcriptional regulator)
MNDQNETTTINPAEPKTLRRLPHEGGRIAGVAAGLASYSGRNIWLIRSLLVLLALAGGIGVALYLGLWAFVPAAGEERSVAVDAWQNRSQNPARAILLALIATAVILGSAHAVAGAALIAAAAIFLNERRSAPAQQQPV